MNDKNILMSVEKILGLYREDYSGEYVPSISLMDYKLAHDIQKEYGISVGPSSTEDKGGWSFTTDTSFFIDDTDIVRGIFKTLLKVKGLYIEESN